MSGIEKLLISDTRYKSKHRDQSTQVHLKGSAKLFHWRSPWGLPPQPIVKRNWCEMVGFPTRGWWPAMWTSRGKTVLNLAAHTFTCCLTFLQLRLVSHSRNYRFTKSRSQYQISPPTLWGGPFRGRYKKFVGSKICWCETPGTSLLAKTKAKRSTRKV